MSEHDRLPIDHLTLPVHEEVIDPVISEVESGRLRIRKRVEEVPVDLLVDADHDEVTVERIAVDRPVDTAPEPWQEGETLVIPVMEEVVVTETRLVVREEIRITRRRVSDQIPIQDTVRREVVEIEEADQTGDTRTGRSQPS
jgi:uncharacterized protein (TIGR02271 family)